MPRPRRITIILIISTLFIFGCKETKTKEVRSSTQPPIEKKQSPLKDINKKEQSPKKQKNVEETKKFAFIKSINKKANQTLIDADYAEFFNGEEANKAAREDGSTGPNETVPNDYYIRNKDEEIKTLKVSTEVEITLDEKNTSDMKPVAIKLKDFMERFNNEDPNKSPLSSYSYWLTIKDDTVTKIEHMYRP